MKIISDFAVSPNATSPGEADAGMRQTNAARVLYYSGAMFQSQPLKLNSQASVAAASSVSVAETVPALTPSDMTLPGLGNMPFYIQSGSSSGDTSLAEIMSFLGKPMTEADVRKAIGDGSPQDMLRLARDNGLDAEEYNNGSWDQVKQQIDQGHPVQALISGDPSGTETDITGANGLEVNGNDLHYVNITGYGTDASTGEEYITYHDPHLGTEQRMSVSDFEKFWGDNIPGGFHNYFQAYGPKGSNLPPGDDAFQNAGGGIQGTQGTLNGIANVKNGWNLFGSKGAELPDMVHGAFQLGGGIPQTGLCFVSQGIQEGASWLHDKVSGIPILQNFVLPLTDLVGGIAGGAADVANAFGESMNDLGGAASDLLHGDGHKALDKLGDAAKDLGNGVVHSVTDAASSVGHAIEDLFSW